MSECVCVCVCVCWTSRRTLLFPSLVYLSHKHSRQLTQHTLLFMRNRSRGRNTCCTCQIPPLPALVENRNCVKKTAQFSLHTATVVSQVRLHWDAPRRLVSPATDGHGAVPDASCCSLSTERLRREASPITPAPASGGNSTCLRHSLRLSVTTPAAHVSHSPSYSS